MNLAIFISSIINILCSSNNILIKLNPTDTFEMNNSSNGIKYTSNIVLIRSTSNSQYSPQTSIQLEKELLIINNLRHKNILKFLRCDPGINEYKLIFENAEHTLNEYLLKSHDKIDLVKQLIDVVTYIHGEQIVIGSEGLTDILVTSDGIIKLYNFGSSEYRRKLDKFDLIDICSKKRPRKYILRKEKIPFIRDKIQTGHLIAQILDLKIFIEWVNNNFPDKNEMLQYDHKKYESLQKILQGKTNYQDLMIPIMRFYFPNFNYENEIFGE